MKPKLAIKYTLPLAISMALAGQVMAQTDQAADTTPEAEGAVEEVIVTGSRIRRDSFTVTTPLVTLDNDAISDTGLGSMSEILVDEIPQVFESSSNMNSQSSVSQTGLSTINLRQLGSNRTLTLIDGRRTVPNSYSGSYVSLSTIPSSLVQRVEIVTGGSSATYGSDAVAGVVNIITQQDKEGFGINGRYGWTPEGGGEEYTIDAEYGLVFGDNRGYMFIGAEYLDQEVIDQDDRDRARWEANFEYDYEQMCNTMLTENSYQCMRDISPEDWRNRSDGIAGGVFEEKSSGTKGYWYDENGLRDDWNEETYGIYSQQFVKLRIPNERFNIAGKVTWDFSETTTGFFQFHYNKTESVNHKSPEDEYEGAYVGYQDPVTGELSRIRPGFIKITNPFAPPEIAENAGSSISWDRRMFEVGEIITNNERTTMRSWAGLQGTLFSDNWDWEVSLGYGEFEQKQVRENEIDVFKEAWALDAEYAEDGVTIQCASAEARADGCVPMNIFGIGSISKEAADYIRVNPWITTNLDQINALGYITGDLFNMPAGAVATVFGLEYRKDTLDLRTSPGQRNGGITFNIVPEFSGDIDVMEAFTEFSFPLTKSLQADVSARIGEYSPKGVNTVFSYTAGLMWEVADGYHLRGNFARAQRAPTITELMSPPRGDYDSYNDICDGVTATSTDEGHANCRLEPGIQAAIAAEGVFEDDNNAYSPNAGNENLFEETGDTWTLGFSMEPSFMNGFRLAVDYYNITITDAIGSFGNEMILFQCYASDTPWGADNPFCGDIKRDDDGQVYELLQRVYNLDETFTDGVDITWDWIFDIGGYGDLTWQGNYTHIFNHETTFQTNDGLETVSYNGQLDYGIFEDVANTNLTWRFDNWRIRWGIKYKGEIIDHQDRVDDYKEALADNDARCAAGEEGCISNPERPKYLWYPSYWRHDLSVSYTMDLSNRSTLRLYGGVKNIFNDMGPFIPVSGEPYEGGVANFDSKYDGGFGRFVFLGADYRF
ncbi:MAG: TonB-dependent receptor [Xanthomonadales bacterium]|jgi:outer membrane receptor protein involved in Fe transport|nr:TonB-dependent receptor [Xanthomonadales bacterium]